MEKLQEQLQHYLHDLTNTMPDNYKAIHNYYHNKYALKCLTVANKINSLIHDLYILESMYNDLIKSEVNK